MNGKIQKYRIKDGEIFSFRVVHNERINGVPTSRYVGTLASVSDKFLAVPSNRIALLAKLDAELHKLKSENKLTYADVKKCKAKFRKKMNEKFGEIRTTSTPVSKDIEAKYPILR